MRLDRSEDILHTFVNWILQIHYNMDFVTWNVNNNGYFFFINYPSPLPFFSFHYINPLALKWNFHMYMYNFISNQEMLNRIAYFITYINIHHTNFPMSERSDKQHTVYRCIIYQQLKWRSPLFVLIMFYDIKINT